MQKPTEDEAYTPRSVESKWQKKWLDAKVYRADDKGAHPYYQLETFPYPSAAGLHVGHPKGYIAEDIHARYMRMQGKDVLYTMGWDTFGLPTENYAIKVSRSPAEVALENIANFKRQVRMFGLSYDWDREINTADPSYYRWTQWIFLQLFKKRLAYRKKAKVNWCPTDMTVLANEQLVDGACERCKTVVEQREMEQWFFKITDYADRLLDEVEGLDWPEESIKRQKDWIGRSEGALLHFKIKNSKFHIPVFTTRPDTLFGATYMVLAPEHTLLKNLESKIKNHDEVEAYVQSALRKTELQRQEEAGEKTGVELKGVAAINPANNEEIPVWVADYILGSYGTGAIMAVPAHDERDFAFAKKFKLHIRPVVQPSDQEIYHTSSFKPEVNQGLIKKTLTESLAMEATVGQGILMNSGTFDGMHSEEAKWKITKAVGGKRQTQYRLRDWSVSRQRYWGVPIPIIHCGACGAVPVPERELPVRLPELTEYRPKGMAPLASAKEWLAVSCPKCGTDAQRESETLDTFVDSSWYFLRYCDPRNEKQLASDKKLTHWLPIQLYVIGAEHTTLHLLYARFVYKFLQDSGHIPVQSKEPFLKLRHVGLINGSDGQKMSKSRGNVVNPDPLIAQYGADAFRIYEMFMGPFEDGQPWDTQGVKGAERFLKRLWKYAVGVIESEKQRIRESEKQRSREAENLRSRESEKQRIEESTNQEVRQAIHQAIKKVGEDIAQFRFNTAIAALMTLMNELEAIGPVAQDDLEPVIKILHPFAPHMAQELWSRLGHDTYLDFEQWPVCDAQLIKRQTVTVGIQVNGKRRGEIEISADAEEAEIRDRILAMPSVAKHIDGKPIKKFIYRKGKIISIVV